MSALTVPEAEALLRDAELSPCVEGGLREMKEILQACLQAGIPAAVGAEPCQDGASCAPKVQLVVRASDVEGVRALMRDRWVALVEGLGVDVASAPSREIPGDGELPCPACGTAAPLVEGACSDCGLQLE
jgi:hypothetical protein